MNLHSSFSWSSFATKKGVEWALASHRRRLACSVAPTRLLHLLLSRRCQRWGLHLDADFTRAAPIHRLKATIKARTVTSVATSIIVLIVIKAKVFGEWFPASVSTIGCLTWGTVSRFVIAIALMVAATSTPALLLHIRILVVILSLILFVDYPGERVSLCVFGSWSLFLNWRSRIRLPCFHCCT